MSNLGNVIRVCPTCGSKFTTLKFDGNTNLYTCDICERMAEIEGHQKYLEFVATGTKKYKDLKAQLDAVIRAATMYERCCDLWQDGLGGMHCRDCSQKTFAMMYEVQNSLGLGKDCKPKPIKVDVDISKT